MIILTLLLIFIILFIASKLSDKGSEQFLTVVLSLALLGVVYYLNLPEIEEDFHDCDGDGVFDIVYVIELDKDTKRRMDTAERIYKKYSPEEKNKFNEQTEKQRSRDCAKWKESGHDFVHIKVTP